MCAANLTQSLRDWPSTCELFLIRLAGANIGDKEVARAIAAADRGPQ